MTGHAANKTQRHKILLALETRGIWRNSILPFPEVKRVLSWFRLGKETRDELLHDLRERGIIEIIPYHGIKILKKSCQEGECEHD
jgi:hypothetical protein